MSQCHDPYNPIEDHSASPAEAVGDQCHDPYPPEMPASPSDARLQHECAVVGRLDGSVRVVRVTGRLDWATEKTFLDYMCDSCANSAVIVDLAEASLDSAGTSALLSAVARAKERGQRLAFVLTDSVELQVLASLGLGDAFPLAASEPAALKWLESHPAPARANS